MSLQSYLAYKKHYQNILNNIEYIIDSYQRIIINLCNEVDYIIKSNKNDNFDTLEKEIFFYVQEKNRIDELLKDYEKKINEICSHQIEEDYIDTGAESCKCIKYCVICETTF